MSVRGEKAEALVRRVLTLIQDDLPPATEVRVKGRSLTATWADPQSGRGEWRRIGVRRIGSTWLPWVPSRVAARWTAMDAVERVLDVTREFSDSNKSTATISGDDIVVTFPSANSGTRTLTLPLNACS